MSAKDTLKNEINTILGREVVVEKPKDKSLAHYATPIAFSLAKELKKSPIAIANEISQKFNSPNYEVSAINGYINFKLSGEFLNSLANEALKSAEKFGSKEIKNPKNIFLEYISANPTGPLHIGHVRGAVYGDTLARVARHIGVGVHTEYYINDAGNQIDLLGISISLRAREILFNEIVEYPEKYYRGEYIDELAKEAYDKFGKDIFDPSRNLELAEFGKDKVLDIIKKDLADAGITIDNWASEKSYYGELDSTLKRLEKSGEVYKKDNTTVNYIVGDYKTISIRNDSVSNDILRSNDIQFIDNLSGDVTSTVSGAKSKGVNSVKILENKTENSRLGDTYTAQTSSESIVITVKLYDYDLSAIAPNKRYKFIFEDPSLTQKYNGVYLISSVESTFINEGKDLALQSIALFKKVVV